MTDIITNPAGELQTAEATALMTQTVQLMQSMAEMIRVTNERMANLEKQVAMLEKVTPAQAKELNRAIGERARVLCEGYRMSDSGAVPAVAAAIRKEVRTDTGARSMRDVARCDYHAVLDGISAWENYKTIKAIKAKEARR